MHVCRKATPVRLALRAAPSIFVHTTGAVAQFASSRFGRAEHALDLSPCISIERVGLHSAADQDGAAGGTSPNIVKSEARPSFVRRSVPAGSR
jgi:hypothetical protein